MRKHLLCFGLLGFAVSGCDLAPDFKLPEIFTPAAFKEDAGAPAVTVEPATDGKWKRFDEKLNIEEFAWWRMFNTPELDALMEQAMRDSPSLEVALQRVNDARAAADFREADLYPSVSAGFGPERQRGSEAALNANSPPGFAIQPKPYTLYTAQGTISYDLDLFGKTRSEGKALGREEEAEEANYRAARLSLQAEVAQNYFRLAALRMEQKVLQKTIRTREQALDYDHQKLQLGSVDQLTVSTGETDLANVKVDAAAVAQQQSVAEHALAILVGQPPSELQAKTADLKAGPPTVPAGLPSALLERRPDIKQAEKQIAAANERIGVARAGYFPDISLSASGGFVGRDLGELFQWSNRSWLIGPLAGTIITQPIFEGGAIAAARAQADAQYQQSVANYRSVVLNAFKETEDQLSGVRNLRTQGEEIRTALAASKRAYDVADQRYKVGYSSHLDMLDAERSYLAAQRNQVQILGNEYVTTIQLVKALGGSWQLPLPEPSTDVTPAQPAKQPAN